MEVVSMRQYNGRNIYSHKPVIKMTVDLGPLAETTTSEIMGFNDRLLASFPGLKTHYCSPGYEGGFVERLEEGTLLSHVTEHVALELQSMLGYDVHFGKTRVVEEPNLYSVLFEYMNEAGAREFGYCAAEIVMALVNEQEFILEDIMEHLDDLASASYLGPSTRSIFKEARRRNIPVRRIGDDSVLQLGYGKTIKYIQASLPGKTCSIAVDIAKNKQLAKELLRDNNIPVPAGGVVYSEESARVLAEQIGYPVVVKPYNSNQGKGVSSNIYNETLLIKAFNLARGYSRGVMVEKYIRGRDYRVLVVGDEVVAVAERKPPFVIGDGINSIAELVAIENQKPERGIGHSKSLTKIALDDVAMEYLARMELRINDIPKPDERIYLRENGNLSTGGSARDCTGDIHPKNKELAVKAAHAVGLDVAGIDIIVDNIAKLITPKTGAVIEVNAAPGLRMHLNPTEGVGKNVAVDILNYMYPEGIDSIPVVAVTGTNGKTTVTRMIRHVLTLAGQKVGMTCSSGTYIGEECISQGDNTGSNSAQLVLYNNEVEAAVLETARGGIIRSGLGYDLADVGVITNISDDHLGIDGINNLDDLAFVKSLVVEAVKPNGYAVLNADDPTSQIIAPRVKCNVIWFGMSSRGDIMKQHIAIGGQAVVIEDEMLTYYKNGKRTEVINVKDIPITFAGKVICNIENSLAVAAVLFSLGFSHHTIRLGLMSFRPDPFSNAGRFNLFDLGSFEVLLDYGHNLSGYHCVSQFVKQMDCSRLVGVVGMPGDRQNKAIFEVGRLCGKTFDKLFIKEDKDLRGRNPGEVANIICQGAISGGAKTEAIDIILEEGSALETALDNAIPGDLIVMFYEKFETNYKIIQDYFKREDNIPNLRLNSETVSSKSYLPSETYSREAGLRLIR